MVGKPPAAAAGFSHMSERQDEPMRALIHQVSLEIEKAWTDQQSDAEALIRIDEILGAFCEPNEADIRDITDGPAL